MDVAFDAVGTVLFPVPSVAEVYASIAARYEGPAVEHDRLFRRFRESLRGEDEIDRANDWATDEVREVDRWRCVVAYSLEESEDVGACFRDLFGHFARPDAWQVSDDAAAARAARTR